jgi:two-component system NtrC family sensor kinase
MTATFTPELAKACLVLALIGNVGVFCIFAYVGRQTQRTTYGLWAVAWLFHAVALAALIAKDFLATDWVLAMIPGGGVAMAALFLFAGNREMSSGSLRRNTITFIAVGIIGIDGIFSGQHAAGWFSSGAFVALALAAVQTGWLHCHRRKLTPSVILMAGGFFLWAGYGFSQPFLGDVPAPLAIGQLLSAAGMVAVALGAIVEHEVGSSEQKYRTIMDGTSDSVFLVDLWTLKILDANLAAGRFARRDPMELVGGSFLELCPDLNKGRGNVLDNRNMFAALFRPFNEFRFVRADGSIVICEGSTALTQWCNRPVVQVRLHEIDREKSANQLVRRAEKMSSLGQLIAGVAHELNNPLAVVVGYSQILAKRPKQDDEVRVSVSRIQHEAERAAKIVRDLLSFARPCEPQFTAVDLNQLVANVFDARQQDLAAQGITVEQRLAPNLSQTKADPIQIEQVLVNLITNAVHAMNQPNRPRQLTVSTAESGLYIHISLADTGCGVAPEILQKIFEPFFTTKAPGRGTGLGLSISHSILEEHHGRIWAESEPGQGTTFHLDLPVVPCEVTAPAPVTEEEKAAALFANQSRRLLVVDDEPGIRDVLEAILTGNGYSVTCAANGVEALSFVRSRKFDLIISDMCMPEMDGEQLYEAVAGQDPVLAKRIIFVTGDTVSAKSRSFLDRTGCRWLGKPFNIRDVESTVDQYLRAHLPVVGVTATTTLST